MKKPFLCEFCKSDISTPVDFHLVQSIRYRFSPLHVMLVCQPCITKYELASTLEIIATFKEIPG